MNRHFPINFSGLPWKYSKLFVLLLFLFVNNRVVNAQQTNLALTATATAFTNDPNGLYQWNLINDGNLGTCGSQQSFIWTSTSGIQGNEHMTFTWSSAKTIDRIVIYHGESANRSLTGALIQIWNGSAWTNVTTVTLPQQCDNTITLSTPVTSTAIRLTDFKAQGSGQQSNMNYREVELYGPLVNNDATVSFLTTPDICSYNQRIVARVTNAGKKNLDSFRLYWSVNSVLQSVSYITCNMPRGRDTSILLNASLAFSANNTYTLKAWTFMPNGTVDSTPANDEMTVVTNFLGNPGAPTTTNFSQCGNGIPTLKASPASPADSITWFDASSGGNYLGLGSSIKGPFLTQSKTFYAQSLKFGPANNKLLLTNAGGYVITNNLATFNGAMFDVSVYNTVMLDSVTFRIRDNNPTTNFRLYYKSGAVAGSQTNSAAWTELNRGQIRRFIQNGLILARVSAKNLLLIGGQSYAFYYTTDPNVGGGNDVYVTGGYATQFNTDINIRGFSATSGLFAATANFNGYSANVELMYTKICLNPNRTALNVTVKPRPIGSDVTKGSIFQGQFKAGSAGFPDISEVGKTISYNILPPNGHNNADHGITWMINSFVARTRYGVIVPSTEYLTALPSGSNNATITFTPKSAYIDSFITFSVSFSDLGPHYCDSTVRRTVVVAPTPKPDFRFPSSICLGDAILFDNVTTIHSGNSSYTWYFGDGDSSDLQSPVHEYRNPGFYTVRLVAKSFPWNVINDTSISLEVGELPDVKFRVNNKCHGIDLTFQNQTTVGNGALTYDWDFGDNTAHSTATNPSHGYTLPGGYRVTLKANANGCIASLSKNAYSFARPVANFSAPLAPVCSKTAVLLPNTSTIALGAQGAYWNFGDGGSSTQYHGDHNFENAGTYAVKLLAVSEFDCKDSITRNVIIKPSPSPEFSGNQFCGKIPTIFTNTTFEEVINPIYTWTFSDGFSSALKNVTRTWPLEGPYTATLKAAYTNGCQASISKSFEVLIQPEANFNVQDICSGEAAVFVNQSKGDRGNIQYFWDFGDGSNSNISAPVRLYDPSITTTYTVALVASYNPGCSDTFSRTLTVSETPSCDFTFKDLGLNKTSFTPSNNTYTKYEWFFGEGGTSLDVAPVYNYLYSGNFDVTMKATNSVGCDCQITKRVSATTAVNSISTGNGISIYPNPNSGNFTITNAASNAMKVEVYNVLGEKVYSKSSQDGSMTVNLSDNAKGIYLVKVTINGVTTTTKITVTN